MQGDDIGYLEKAQRGIIYSLAVHYISWSSRVFIEFVMMCVLYTSFWLWKILDVFMGLLLAYSMVELTGDRMKLKVHWVAIMLVLSIQPLLLEGGAGYCATATNYYWTSVLAVFAMIPVKCALTGKEKDTSRKAVAVYSLALVYAANLEQVCVVLIMFMGGVTIFLLYKKEFPLIIKVYDILLVLELIFILTCPGNSKRYISEINTWFPEYGGLNLPQKISMGMGNTLYQILYNTLFIFIVLCVVMVIYLWKISRLKLVIPALSLILFQIFKERIIQEHPGVNDLFNRLAGDYPSDGGAYGYKFGSITADNFRNWVTYIPIVGLSLLMAGIIISCLVAAKKQKDLKMLVCGVLLSSGFASRCVMCFSPTIWASDKRTFIPFYFCIILCTCLLFDDEKKMKNGVELIGETSICLMGIVSYIISALRI